MSNQKGNAKMTNYRWVMCAMLFLATTVNYMDRQVLSLTWKDFIAPEFHWTDADYGTITAAFSLIYAVCMLFAGKLPTTTPFTPVRTSISIIEIR